MHAFRTYNYAKAYTMQRALPAIADLLINYNRKRSERKNMINQPSTLLLQPGRGYTWQAAP